MSRGPEHTKVYGHEETNVYCEVSNANIYRLTQMERKKWRVGRRDGGLCASFWWSVDAHRLESLPSPTTMTDQPTRCQHMFLAELNQPPALHPARIRSCLAQFSRSSIMCRFGSGERIPMPPSRERPLPTDNSPAPASSTVFQATPPPSERRPSYHRSLQQALTDRDFGQPAVLRYLG